MSDLWAEQRTERRRTAEPLAVRLRPRTLEEFAGQGHFLAPGGLLRRMLDADRLTSVLFWGPPGTGKTTLAELIANETSSTFERGHAAMIGVKDLRALLADARRRLEESGRKTILFLDEIHRFSRSQQDVLLADVERGIVTLIGATTENPSFTVNDALLSRSTVFQFEPLEEADIRALLERAIGDDRGFGDRTLRVAPDAIDLWSKRCDGDARRALTALEVAVLSQPAEADGTIEIDLATAEESLQKKAPRYDRAGDTHYDVASAFIKSMRGSDPDAAVYWLARMLDAGEDPRFIARRIAIFASEDIGNADPHAINVAASAWTITERVGLPECRLTLAHATLHMACAPKSNACTRAIGAASALVHEGRDIAVPRHLRSTSERGMVTAEQQAAYRSPHQDPDLDQEYLGVNATFYEPTDNGAEARIRARRAQP